jgi:hypothetical protein
LKTWQEIGHKLALAERSVAWWIGDWWICGDHRYGARARQCESWDLLRLETCMNYGSVCRAFPPSRRREALSFSHHAAVASLPAADADRLLDRCEKEGKKLGRPLPVTWLRAAVQRHNRPRGLSPADFADIEQRRKEGEQTRRLIEAIPPGEALPPVTLDVSVADGGVPASLRELKVETPFRLDRSGANAPVPEDLRDLKLEPPPMDHMQMAAAAIAQLEFAQALDLFCHWFRGHPPETREAVLDHLGRDTCDQNRHVEVIAPQRRRMELISELMELTTDQRRSFWNLCAQKCPEPMKAALDRGQKSEVTPAGEGEGGSVPKWLTGR